MHRKAIYLLHSVLFKKKKFNMVIIFWGMIYDYIAIAALIYIVENVNQLSFLYIDN